jgi:hypothetical protein
MKVNLGKLTVTSPAVRGLRSAVVIAAFGIDNI